MNEELWARAKTAAARALRELARSGTPRRAAGTAAYFRSYEGLEFFGVDSATIRRLAASVHANAGQDWDLDAARSFAEALLARPELEAKLLGIVLLGRFRRQFDPSLLGDARRWLERWCHLMHKAVGWLPREAGKTDAPRLERFLRRHGRRLSRTSVRYAIERFPAGKRATLLKLTRP